MTHQSTKIIGLILTLAFLHWLLFDFVRLIEMLFVGCFGSSMKLMNVEGRMRDVLFSILYFILIDRALHFG